jgi:hypothetical protein
MTAITDLHTQTAEFVTDAFCQLLIARRGHAYASSYISSLLQTVVLSRLTADQQAEFAADISQRLSEEVRNMSN